MWSSISWISFTDTQTKYWPKLQFKIISNKICIDFKVKAYIFNEKTNILLNTKKYLWSYITNMYVYNISKQLKIYSSFQVTILMIIIEPKVWIIPLSCEMRWLNFQSRKPLAFVKPVWYLLSRIKASHSWKFKGLWNLSGKYHWYITLLLPHLDENNISSDMLSVLDEEF